MLRVMFALLPLLGLAGAAMAAEARAPLIRNPTLLNIGFICRWHNACMDRQERAMEKALAYVRKHDVPAWKIQLCNRNASKGRSRVDWVGYNNCVRNSKLKAPRRLASR